MASVELNGGRVEYEFLGDAGAPVIVVTPGGRFSKDVPGVRRFGEALAAGGHRVLLWDRPNCGQSEVQFFGRTESHMRAETLHALLSELDVAPCVIAGGSGGARDSILTTILHPELATRLVVWAIVGGVYGTVALSHNVLPSITAVRTRGMDGVLATEPWKTLIEVNPRNRDRIVELGEDGFQRVMLRWLNAFIPKAGETVPGVADELFERITVPTLIIRGGAKDLNHPRRASLEVHTLIEGSTLIEPPWPEDAWEQESRLRTQGKAGIFDYWELGVPDILEFLTDDPS
ncbi:MAG: alpha/beta hydrolase [Acidimicrobiaceae bacterium]|nr:alpha/beta hydrolase [Acidimicrobiaceae bacterium]